MKPAFQVDQHVEVKGQLGVIRYFGETKFAEGEWVGVELDTSEGRNDGSVNGVRYFNCSKQGQYGVFVRPALVEFLESAGKGPEIKRNLETVVERLQQKLRKALEDTDSQRKKVEEMEASISSKDTKIDDLEAHLEASTVNAEYLEAQNETLQKALEDLRSKFDELKLEYELATEELSINRQLEEELMASMPTELDASETISILRSNRILKDTLEKLSLENFKKTSANEAHEAKFKSLDHELELLKSTHKSTLESLNAAETTIKDLQQQLETISGSADLLEHLTSQNVALQDKVDDLTLAIQELNELRELDKALLAENARSENVLKATITDLEKSVKSHTSTITTLNANNSRLKSQLDKYLTQQNLAGIDQTGAQPRLPSEIGEEHLSLLLSSAKAERAKLIEQIVPAPLGRQVLALVRLSDLSNEARMILEKFRQKPITHEWSSRGVLRALACLVKFKIILEFNGLNESDLMDLEKHIEDAENYIGIAKTSLREINSDHDRLGQPLSLANFDITSDTLNMSNFVSLIYTLLDLQADTICIFNVLKYLEEASMRRLPGDLSVICDLVRRSVRMIEENIQKLERNGESEINPVNLASVTLDPVWHDLWQIAANSESKSWELSEEKAEFVSQEVLNFHTSTKSKLGEVIQQYRSLQHSLERIEPKFSDVVVPNVFASSNASEKLMSATSSEPEPDHASKEKTILELELHIKLLEQNLSDINEKSSKDFRELNDKKEALGNELKELQEKYNTLLEENRSLERQVLEYLNVETLTLAGQQTKAFKDFASDKGYSTEFALYEEISFLRKMINAKHQSEAASKIEDLMWLKSPIMKGRARANLSPLLNFARNRRAYAVRMSEASTGSIGRGQFVYPRLPKH